MSQKHQNYKLLNLLGYGLAKFDNDFIKEFNCNTKTEFFNLFMNLGIVKTASVVKNRMDLFDHFFPNHRKGWWQKGNAYIHRKYFIDSLFGNEDVKGFANVIKLILSKEYSIDLSYKPNPILESKFKKMQSTGLEAEMFFLHNYHQIECLKNGQCIDARIYGDGYDFFIQAKNDYLCEIKGLRGHNGSIRLTQNEYYKAREFKDFYLLVIVVNLDNIPQFKSFNNPINNLLFTERILKQKELKEYHLKLSFPTTR